MLGQFLRFAAVGAVATAAQYAVLIALKELLGVNPVVGTALGFCLGAIVSYSLNRHFTFDHRPAFAAGLAKFFVAVGVGFFLNVGIVWALTHQGVFYIWAAVAATLITLFWNFFATRMLVFREPSRS
jgi:putative flippase GtrA